MGEAFTFVSHTCLHSDALLVRASFLFFALWYSRGIAFVCSHPERRRMKGTATSTAPMSSRSRWALFFTSYVWARTFFPPKKWLACGKCLHSVTLLVRARSFRFMVLKGYCVRLQSSGEEAVEEKKSTGCHNDSPVLFDFEEDDEEDYDSYGMLVSLPLSYDAW